MLVVDTSVWVDHFNAHKSAHADYLYTWLDSNQPLVMPGIVLTEILLGFRSNAEAKRARTLLSSLDAAPELAQSDYVQAAGIYRKCRTAGITVSSVVDCLIAQTCLSYDFAILSKDRDFQQIARHFPLRVVNPANAD
jgi:hypothetical protein